MAALSWCGTSVIWQKRQRAAALQNATRVALARLGWPRLL